MRLSILSSTLPIDFLHENAVVAARSPRACGLSLVGLGCGKVGGMLGPLSWRQ